MINDIIVELVQGVASLPITPFVFGLVAIWLFVCVFKCFYKFVFADFPSLYFGFPSSKSDPFKFADKVFKNSDLNKVFYTILERDLQYFQVWYSPNKKDIKKFKKTAVFSFKCLIIELFYFDSDFESISSFYDSESFDVVLFSIVLGEHSDLKYYHDLPNLFRTLVNDKEKILLIKEQINNEKK